MEDDANDALLTTRFLGRWRQPLDIHVATNIEEAAAYLKATPNVSLVLLDYMMPGCSGLDLLREFRKDDGPLSTTPVVVLTGNNSGEVVRVAREAGANSCVFKPVDPEEYERTMASIAEFWLGANLIARREERASLR